MQDRAFPAPLPAPVFSASDRIAYLGVSLGALATLGLARMLRPSPSGVGTHEQLGLPACPFLHLTGFPCPTCGMTTSFTHAAHLHFYEALIVQPAGFLTFLLTIACIPACLALMRRRVPWDAAIHSRFADPLMYALLAVYLLGWIYKIAAMKGRALGGW